MVRTDKLKHVLLAMAIYDEPAFEEELIEIAKCINEDKAYDLDPSLSRHDLVDMVNHLLETMEQGGVQERVMRFMVRKILMKEAKT